MKLLENNGMHFAHDPSVEIFKKHGFKTDGKIVYMTEKDVQNALKTTPRTFDWHGRKSHVTVGGGETICAPVYGPVFILEDGEFHGATQRDFLNFTKLHATSEVLQVSNPNMMDLSFMPLDICSNWAMATTLMMDERPAIGMVDGTKSARDSITMTQEFLGIYDKVVLGGLISVASPCCYTDAMCESLIEYATARQAVFITPSSINGLTAPGSLASLLLLNNTEVLAGVVLSQLINPGAPVIYGIQSHGSDLRHAVPCVGSPEQCLIFSAAKAMGSYYNLPVRTGGSSGDAKLVDMQAGVESFSTMYATLQSGADLMIHSCGGMDSDCTLSYDKFIYDEEVLQSVQRILRGIEVTEATLLYDEILEVGPGHDFLGYSLDEYKNDFIHPWVPNRVSHSGWLAHGAETITQRTKKIYTKRLAEYRMPELEKERRGVLEKFVGNSLVKTVNKSEL